MEQSAISLADLAGSDTQARLQAALVGRYKVERELGAGGMATVFLAKDEKHDREVAIKVLHPDLAASIGGERFEREIKLAAKLQHPHILGLFDSGAASGLLYYVMPFVKGESLRDRLDRENMLPIEDAVRITLEICDALGYAHSQGIVHRDIKPENILLQGGHALVADFGIARPIGEAGSGGQKLTQTGMSLGTPVYMAPEQATGEGAGPTADLYSLACVLYEMLAGEPPFTGTTPMAVMKRHLMEQVPSVRIVRDSVPDEIEQVIFAAMSKVPVDRPQTAAQFAEFMGMPFGATATMRAMRSTSTRRVPSAAQTVVIQHIAPWYKRKMTYVTGAALLVAVAAGLWGLRGKRSNPLAEGPDARRIAVVYFEDRSSDGSLRALADGLTEGLTRSLATSPTLTVISRSGTQQFRGTTVPVDSIARALRAGHLVTGEVEDERDRIRVSVKLVDAAGITIQRTAFAVGKNEGLRMRDSLVQVATAMIRENLGPEIRLRDQRAATDNQAAWLFVQRGGEAEKRAETFYGKGDTANANAMFRAADSLFAAAEPEDATWSEPLVQRAMLAERRSRIVGRDPAAIRPWVTVGVAFADTALVRDANNADAFEARGKLRYWSWLSNLEADPSKKLADLMSAKTDLEKAVALNSSQAGAYATLSHLYYQIPSSTTNDVYIAAQRALQADEFLVNANVVLARLFLAAYDLEQFDAAEQYCNDAKHRFPEDPRSARCQLFLMTTPRNTSPDLAAAWRLADTLAAKAPEAGRKLERMTADMLVAATIARASKNQPVLGDSARHVAKRSEGDATIDQTRDLAYRGAFVYTILGDKPDALRLLKAYIAANPQRRESLKADPGWWFRDLREDSGFRLLVGGD